MPQAVALFLALFISLFTSLFIADAARAQLPGMPARAAQATAAAVPTAPNSPRAALEDYLRLTAAGDYDGAAQYLMLSPAERSRADVLARRLRTVLDQRLAIDVRTLSPLASGDTTDGDADRDRIGSIAGSIAGGGGREEPVLLMRSADRSRWQFAPVTVASVDHWFENLGNPWLRDRLPPALMREGPFSVFLWQWIGLAIAIPLLLLLTWLITAAARSVVGRLTSRTDTTWDDLLVEHLRSPFRLWVASVIAQPLLALLDLNARIAAFVTASVRVGVLLALFWALLRAIRLVQQRMENVAWAAGHTQQARTLAPLVGNFLRVTLVIVAVLVALAQFGYPVGTLLAGLGIGGIAVALAAQKTVEHLFGSVSLAADKVFRVGDWVRAGTTEGAVERIGLRSTSFRTNDRTVVRVPNGRLADERIETFGERDRMLLRTDLDLVLSTPLAQVERTREQIRSLITAHPLVWPGAIRVHVVAFTDSAIRLNVMAWFLTPNYDDFLEIRHRLLLAFMRIIEQNGSSFALPSRTIYHVTQDGTTAVAGPASVAVATAAAGGAAAGGAAAGGAAVDGTAGDGAAAAHDAPPSST